MQIPLELKLPVKASFDDFVSNQKQEITSAIQELINKFEHHFIFLSGANATGKTHLLSALCQSAETADQSIIYLPLQQADEFPPEICEGIETADIICLDDIDAIAGNNDWEIALFNLYNRLRDHGKNLIISSQYSIGEIPIQLPDLKSRLAWGINITLKALSDENKKLILKNRAEQLGMKLPEEASNYLLRHQSRTMTDLLDTLNKLERASLAAQRKLTIPFIKGFLNLQEP